MTFFADISLTRPLEKDNKILLGCREQTGFCCQCRTVKLVLMLQGLSKWLSCATIHEGVKRNQNIKIDTSGCSITYVKHLPYFFSPQDFNGSNKVEFEWKPRAKHSLGRCDLCLKDQSFPISIAALI